jgi:hypothetical protein
MVVLGVVGGVADASAAGFAFQPIEIQRINLPSSVTGARWPGFTKDGQHLLFWSAAEMWITDLQGGGAHCLTCGLANNPKLLDSLAATLATMATPFPDGKRVLIEEDIQILSTGMVVLECAPSLVDCEHRQLVPVDYSAAEQTVLPPGGALSLPQIGLPNVAAHAQLSPDGNFVGFSQARSDAIEAMIVGRLERGNGRYVVKDPRVINPPGPTSPSDPNAEAWSDSSALYEFKTFTNGGADATYVEVGGPGQMSTDIWSVNLATGRRTRLTSNPDWDEDNAVSPNGELMSIYSTRTMHYVDWSGGLLPVRDFIDGPAAAMSSSIGGSTACMGPMWLLPASGDQGAAIAGQPILEYRYPHVHVVDTLAESSQWSPDGTMIALDTTDDSTGNPAPFLLVAHLTSLRPSKPLPAVSSQPGSWASPPTGYHGAIGYLGTKTLRGPGGGTVTVQYGGTPGAIAGQWSQTYKGYSDNGADFVNGKVTAAGLSTGTGTYSSHLTMTGAHSGHTNSELTFNSGIQGHGETGYDGTTVKGPSADEANSKAAGGPGTACPGILPKKPALRVSATNLGHSRYRVKVTSSVAGVGANEAAVDTRPVQHATLLLGRSTAYTNAAGVAVVNVRKSGQLSVSAGDTLVPTAAYLRASKRRG